MRLDNHCLVMECLVYCVGRSFSQRHRAKSLICNSRLQIRTRTHVWQWRLLGYMTQTDYWHCSLLLFAVRVWQKLEENEAKADGERSAACWHICIRAVICRQQTWRAVDKLIKLFFSSNFVTFFSSCSSEDSSTSLCRHHLLWHKVGEQAMFNLRTSMQSA